MEICHETCLGVLRVDGRGGVGGSRGGGSLGQHGTGCHGYEPDGRDPEQGVTAGMRLYEFEDRMRQIEANGRLLDEMRNMRTRRDVRPTT